MSTPRDDSSARQVRGLRGNSIAAIVILPMEYGLGIDPTELNQDVLVIAAHPE